MKIPTYATKDDYTYYTASHETKLLPSGTFVKPLNINYIPEHVKERTDYKWFNDSKEVFVYCNHGIIVIPKKLIMEV